MQARMGHPARVVPGARAALLALGKAAQQTGLSQTTITLVHLRVSQINGCGVCVHMHAQELRETGESDERIDTVAGWRDAPFFTGAERVALELAEALTRVSDRPDPITDELYDEAAKHYDEPQLAALILAISTINVWNRLNLATRQVVGKIAS